MGEEAEAVSFNGMSRQGDCVDCLDSTPTN